MTIKEAERLSVMKQLKNKKLKQREASEILGLSLRQTQRLIRSYKEEGPQGLISKKRGKTNPRKMPLSKKLKIIATIKEKYLSTGHFSTASKLVVNNQQLKPLKEQFGFFS